MNKNAKIKFYKWLMSFYDNQSKIIIQEYLKKRKNIVILRKILLSAKRNKSLAIYALTNSGNNKYRDRKLWSIARKSRFWEDEVPSYDDNKFKEHFRMNRSSFADLISRLKYLERTDTHLRASIKLEKRIAVALYALGSSAEYRTIANMFGIGRTTVGELVLEFCDAINFSLKEDFLNCYPPSQEKVVEIVNGFEKLGFPQCFGAIDGCHIEIQPLKEDAVDYFNFKGWYSIILLAVVDYRYKFSYINVGSPGRNNDSYIYENSLLKEMQEGNPIFEQNYRVIEGVDVPVMLIGDSAFRLSRNMMKPYPFIINQPKYQEIFNKSLSACRRVVENVFGHLKARFRKIGRGLELHPDNAALVIKACCILHNFCTEKRDEAFLSWLNERSLDQTNCRVQPNHSTRIGNTNTEATTIRDAIAKFLERNAGRDVTIGVASLDEDEDIATEAAEIVVAESSSQVDS